MVKVSKITVTEHSFDNQLKKPDAAMKQCLELIPAKELAALFPKKVRYQLRFRLEDANSQLANAIRRCLVDELPTYSLTFNLMHDATGKPADFITDLRTNDKHIFGKCDYLKKRIEGIPIRQNINPDEWKISMEVQNNTGDLIDITAADFKLTHKGKVVPVDDLMYSRYILMRIYPKCYLRISNIRIEQGLGMVNGNSFKKVTDVYYEIEDAPMQKNASGGYSGKSSMDSNYKNFTMGYSTYRNDVKVYDPIKMTCELLVQRLDTIGDEWKKIKDGELSDKIQVTKEGTVNIIHLEGETYTLANLLYYYVYLEMPSIEFASGGIKHLDKIGGMVQIKHANYIEIFANAIKAAIKDLKAVGAAFK